MLVDHETMQLSTIPWPHMIPPQYGHCVVGLVAISFCGLRLQSLLHHLWAPGALVPALVDISFAFDTLSPPILARPPFPAVGDTFLHVMLMLLLYQLCRRRPFADGSVAL